ncbi:hypothetical protein PGT21_008968 [Puccinia graminis f. sp. tritici]|uniref:Uncharacterized protein n=2 Tax=Puccinia graminis f. sp. tritici TaxID=56615 RepID=E3K9D1_PUCGT|nr:uncharacterized protein PGTG_07318 [Puccinia graminis f. sp. tritici CRL 75-36-700-3]EFP81066.1 hypothetical protein PGTG_07318 [Puccinia graminis f. sp. tritici CRL 75-36-700-3]KAA1069011.1 hypothetical protein PGT21_008968 [Puccinia graminis f. sp. tritici]KAA1123681.1 hypothetical protein PGTUg99_027078 [Puccinia graminis f. sp. tritici]
MVKPTKPESIAPKTDQSISRQIDLIAQVFRSFKYKYDIYHNRRLRSIFIEEIVPIDQASCLSILSRLELSLLPLLGHQISTISRMINSSDLRRGDTPSKLQLITELQLEIDQSVDQIFSCAPKVHRKPSSSTDDNYLKNLKSFRFPNLLVKVGFLIHELSFLFDGLADLIRGLKLSQKKYRRKARKFNTRGKVAEYTASTSESIECLIKWIKGHELTNIQEEWDVELTGMDEVLAEVTKLINPTSASESGEEVEDEGGLAAEEDDGDENDDEDDQSQTEAPSEAFFQLARSTVPMIKLSRLFFRKLSTSGIDQSPSEPFTEMSTSQLETLNGAAGDIDCELNRIWETLNKAGETDEDHTAHTLYESVDKMSNSFQSYMLLLTLYVLPLVPQIEHNPDSSQNNLKTWLITWNNLFISATEKIIIAAQTFENS